MSKSNFNSLFLISIFFITSVVSAQNPGKIFERAKADSLFGKPYESITLQVDTLKSVLNSTETTLMFRLQDGKLVILGDGRKGLYPRGISVDSAGVFIRYSKEKLMEILGAAKNSQVLIENRIYTLTITNGNNTLEYGLPCPPECE